MNKFFVCNTETGEILTTGDLSDCLRYVASVPPILREADHLKIERMDNDEEVTKMAQTFTKHDPVYLLDKDTKERIGRGFIMHINNEVDASVRFTVRMESGEGHMVGADRLEEYEAPKELPVESEVDKRAKAEAVLKRIFEGKEEAKVEESLFKNLDDSDEVAITHNIDSHENYVKNFTSEAARIVDKEDFSILIGVSVLNDEGRVRTQVVRSAPSGLAILAILETIKALQRDVMETGTDEEKAELLEAMLMLELSEMEDED